MVTQPTVTGTTRRIKGTARIPGVWLHPGTRPPRPAGRGTEGPAQGSEADQADRSGDDGDHGQVRRRATVRRQRVEPRQRGRRGGHPGEGETAALPLRAQPGHPTAGVEGEPPVQLVGQRGGGERPGEVGRLAAEAGEQDEQHRVEDVSDAAHEHEPGELRPCVVAAELVQQSGGRLLHTSILGADGAEVVVPADPLRLLRPQ